MDDVIYDPQLSLVHGMVYYWVLKNITLWWTNIAIENGQL